MSVFGVQTWSSWEAYAAYLADERAYEAEDERRREAARQQFCHHGKNMLQRCTACEDEEANAPDSV